MVLTVQPKQLVPQFWKKMTCYDEFLSSFFKTYHNRRIEILIAHRATGCPHFSCPVGVSGCVG